VIDTMVASGRDKQGCPPLSPCVSDATAASGTASRAG